MRNYRPTCRLDGHTDSVTAVAFSPNGLFLASAGVDGRLFLWSIDDGKCAHEVTQLSCGFSSLVWLDNERILAGKEDGKGLLVTSSIMSYTTHLFPLHVNPIEALACRGGVVASGAHEDILTFAISNNHRIQVKRRIAYDFDNAFGPTIVTSLHWIDSLSPNILLVTYLHHGVVIWNTETSESISRIDFSTRIGDSSISSDHRLLIISNLSTGFDAYDLDTKQRVRTWRGGQYFIGGSSVGRLPIWRLSEDAPVGYLVHKGQPVILSIAETYSTLSGRTIVACGTAGRDQDSYIQVWQSDVYVASTNSRCSVLFLILCIPIVMVCWLLRDHIPQVLNLYN